MAFETLNLPGVTGEDQVAVMPFDQEDIQLHDHDFLELAYVTRGTAVQNIEGARGKVRAGDYFIIDFGTRHSYQECRNLQLINCLFLPEVVDDTLAGCRSLDGLLQVCMVRYYRKYLRQPAANRIFHDEDGRVRELLEGMKAEFEEKNVGYMEIFRCRLKEILILTMRRMLQEDRVAADPNVSGAVLETIRYLERHYKERAVLQEFCREHHYSQQYISRRFRLETGMSALEYLQKIRIEKSCELLAGSDMSIQDVAQAVGYEDVKFWGSLFKRSLRMTPREYRKVAAQK